VREAGKNWRNIKNRHEGKRGTYRNVTEEHIERKKRNI
jgi:hypothetical protein